MVLNNDNEDSRKMVEQCYKRNKTVINPIIDWSNEEVWEFIKYYNIPYCKLYDKGFKRLGCVGCPMGNAEKELNLYPAIKRAYIRAFDKMIKARLEAGLPTEWETGEQVMEWWLGRK